MGLQDPGIGHPVEVLLVQIILSTEELRHPLPVRLDEPVGQILVVLTGSEAESAVGDVENDPFAFDHAWPVAMPDVAVPQSDRTRRAFDRNRARIVGDLFGARVTAEAVEANTVLTDLRLGTDSMYRFYL